MMLSETSTGTPAIAVAALESGPLSIDGAMPASRPSVARTSGGIHSGHAGSWTSFSGAVTAKRQHAREQSGQSQKDACEHDQSQ